MTDRTTFPAGFGGIGGKSFKFVRENRLEWCQFTIEKMRDTTGFFEVWRNYLLNNQDAPKNEIKLRSTDGENRSTNK